MKKIRAAVIGIGHLGKEHARIYHELEQVDLIAVCDKDRSKAEIAEKLKTEFVTDYRDILNRVDVVSVVTPTTSHYSVGKDVLNAGVHALIEKPITPTLEQADELIDIARTKNLSLYVGHLERHNAGFRKIEKIAHNVRFIEIHRLGPFSARISDCGVVLDLMIHDLDIVLQLVKSEIESIDAIGIPVLTPYEDIANVRIKFKNKAIADITASRLTPDRQRKIRLFQEDAYISLDYISQTAQIYQKANLAQALVGEKIHRDQVDIVREEPLKAELIHFVNSVSRGTSNGKPDIAARNALKVALDILQSIKENSPLPIKI